MSVAERGDSKGAARGEMARIAEERAALRRVAALVARGVSQDELFAAVTRDVARLVGADATSLMHFEADDTVSLVAAWNARDADFPIGSRRPIDDALRSIRDTGRPLRWGPAELGVPIPVEGRVWGVAYASSTTDQPFADDAEARIAGLAELVAAAIASAQARADLRMLADEQAALRRVATLVARGVPPSLLFSAVTEEVGCLLDADLAGMTRYVSDDGVIAVATWAAKGEHPDVPGVWPVAGDRVSPALLRTGRPAREDHWETVETPSSAFIRDQMGVRCSVASPIVVEGRVWGGLWVHSTTAHALPPDTETRLEKFTEIVGTAIANSQARADADRLAAEQAALRRVATLVARESSPDEVFAAVTEEVCQLLAIEDARMVRFERDGTATVVASWGEFASALPVGTSISLEGTSVSALVFRSGRAARIADFADAQGDFAAAMRDLGVRSAVGAPIVVDGRLWGAMSTASLKPEPIPADTEARMREFTELVATAISNTEARSELAASRARIVAAADEERRRVVRDLHDGAQQRLVHTIVTLTLAQQALDSDPAAARRPLAEALEQTRQATHELRELSHGIMPAVLTRGGLREGVEALASRSPVPVVVHVAVGRLPATIESTAYFVVAEALTNVSKHARATRATVTARIDDHTLWVAVRDDGVGGARAEGSGLVGLRDRLAALDGRLRVESPAEGGTVVAAAIPLRD